MPQGYDSGPGQGPRAGHSTGRQRESLVNIASKTAAREGPTFRVSANADTTQSPQTWTPRTLYGMLSRIQGGAGGAVGRNLDQGTTEASQFVFGQDRPPSILEMLGAMGPVVPGSAAMGAATQAPKARTLFGAMSQAYKARQAFSGIRNAQAARAVGRQAPPALPQSMATGDAERFILESMRRVRGGRVGGDPRAMVGLKSVHQFEALKRSIANEGITDPLQFVYDSASGKGMIGDGAHRILAAKELGLSRVPIKVVSPMDDFPTGAFSALAGKKTTEVLARFNQEAFTGAREALKPMKLPGGGIAPPPGYRTPRWLEQPVRGNRL